MYAAHCMNTIYVLLVCVCYNGVQCRFRENGLMLNPIILARRRSSSSEDGRYELTECFGAGPCVSRIATRARNLGVGNVPRCLCGESNSSESVSSSTCADSWLAFKIGGAVTCSFIGVKASMVE
jgi:hypothetical protein